MARRIEDHKKPAVQADNPSRGSAAEHKPAFEVINGMAVFPLRPGVRKAA